MDLAMVISHLNVLEYTVAIGISAVLAGFLGSLTGLGGGVIMVPVLVLGFGVDIHYAAGASLIAVIATSSGSAAAYVRDRLSNIRIGMVLEVATTFGAVMGALIATVVNASLIAIIFGVLLVFTAISAQFSAELICGAKRDWFATKLGLDGTYTVGGETKSYTVCNVPGGFLVMIVAGALSGLLGIGSGALKVVAMDRIMRMPFKVSTTTSNFMIGVTAAASAGVYLSKGYVDPGLSMPVLLGVVVGSYFGSHLFAKSGSGALRVVFTVAMLAIAAEMIYKGFTGGL